MDNVIRSVKNHRDRRARYYKPVCVLAALDLVDRGILSPDHLTTSNVLDRFYELVNPIFPSSADKGWMPFWHLTSDKLWQCRGNTDTKITRSHFPAQKPRTRNQLVRTVTHAVVDAQNLPLWTTRSSRQSLAMELISMLESDSDIAASAMGTYVKNMLPLVIEDREPKIFTDNFDFDEQYFLVKEDYAKFKAHLRIERSQSNIKKVKKFFGCNCMLCGFNFDRAYGKIGTNYIEAHHLTPIASRKLSKVDLDIRYDFAVLCANCHRMVHISGLPSDLDAFRAEHTLPTWVGNTTAEKK